MAELFVIKTAVRPSIYINMKTPSKFIYAAILVAGLSIIIPGYKADAATANAVFSRNLSLGSRGSDVVALQKMLIKKGYLKVAATNYFGKLTQRSLAAWQKAAGIRPASGYFGPLSRQKLAGTTAFVPPSNTAATPTPTPVADAGTPVRLKIPKLNVNTAILESGLKADGSLDAPANIFDAGWYKNGAAPGENGSAIITGHVAQIRGGVVTKPGVFYDLSKLKPGDKIYIENNKGETITFTVRTSKVYEPNAAAPEVFASSGGSTLSMITCEGTWNPAKQSYSGRLVVFADKSS
jgi:LPXTG-site transpeptidase (sortase) family protein